MCHKTCKLRPPLDKPAFMATCVFDSLCIVPCTFRSAGTDTHHFCSISLAMAGFDVVC